MPIVAQYRILAAAAAALTLCLAALPALAAEDKDCLACHGQEGRITSYNVCYTKLLRDRVELERGRYNGPTANVPLMMRV